MASWQVEQLKFAFGIGGLMSLYGIVGLIVWVMGEKLNTPVQSRYVVIALVLLTLPFALVGMYVAKRRKKKKEAKAAAETATQEANVGEKADAAPQKLTNPTGNYAELNQAAEETVQFLKSSNVGNGKDAVYALPWYVVAGTPKSGKTSLSLASGLNFQNLPSQRQSEQKFIRPTRSIDWRVTNDAVFLDTAGRYQTEGVDGDEWSAILETIKKYRAARPLDGMILPISAERILHGDDAEIEQMAKVLRARIDEAMQRTKIRFPIYLVFTHADSIEGFRDSFSTSQREGQNLVWGATIPLEKSASAHSLFDSEYDLLQNSVMKRRLMRLSAPFPPVRQLKIFNFPLHFGSARKKLGHFVATLFRPNPFSESPFLRGFYFTAVPVNRPQIKAGQTMANIAPTVGQSYFTQKLFRDVILRDKDLVANFQAQKVKPPIMGWLLTALGAFLVLGFLIMSAYSLYQNRVLANDIAARGEAILNTVKADRDRNVLDKKPEEVRDEVGKIEDLRVLLDKMDGYDQNGAPLSMRFGFYSGNRLFHEGLLRYVTVVEQRFKKPTVKKLEDDLRKFSVSNPVAKAEPTEQELQGLEKNYKLLKGYLMLSGEFKEQAEAGDIAEILEDYWISESKVPKDMGSTAKNQLDFYAKQVKREEFPRIVYDTKLVEDVRKKLLAYPAYLRYYNRVTTDISKEIEPVSTDSILAGSSNVLKGTSEVRGVYTKAGYLKMKEAISKAQDEMSKEDWVMGKTVGAGQAQTADIERLRSKYFNDYIQNWRKFIQGVSVPPYQNKGDAVTSLKALSEADSPMKLIIEKVSTETNLSGETATGGWFDWLWSWFGSSKKAENAPGTPVDKEFKPLFDFTKAGNSISPISQYGNELGTIFDGKKADDDFEKLSLSEITDQVAAEKGGFVTLMRGVEKKIDTRINIFKDGGAQQDIANLLKKPIDNLNTLVDIGIRPKLEKEWATKVLPQAREIEKGYPFAGDGDADLTKLTAYLNPKDGVLSDFYEKQLKKYIEETNGQYKVKADSTVQFSDEFVKYLTNAFRLREALFGKNNTAQFAYEFKIQKVSGAIIEMTIDGQPINSDGTGSTALKFPAQSGETGVSMKLGSTADLTSTTAPATTDANTNSSSPAVDSGGTNSRSFPGTWGLFKFFDAGSPKAQPTGEYILTYSLGGKNVSATVKASGGNLFDRTLFTAVRAPEKF